MLGSVGVLMGPFLCVLVAFGDRYSRLQLGVTQWEFDSGAFPSPR